VTIAGFNQPTKRQFKLLFDINERSGWLFLVDGEDDAFVKWPKLPLLQKKRFIKKGFESRKRILDDRP